MKYVCEVCGRQFENEIACSEHEKQCKKKHAALIKVKNLINEAIAIAKTASISIVLSECNVVEKTFIIAAELGDDLKTVFVSIE